MALIDISQRTHEKGAQINRWWGTKRSQKWHKKTKCFMWSIVVFHAHVLTTDIYFVASVDADNNSTSTMADEDKKRGWQDWLGIWRKRGQ